MFLDRDDEREADDRAVHDPGDLPGAEMGFDCGTHERMVLRVPGRCLTREG